MINKNDIVEKELDIVEIPAGYDELISLLGSIYAIGKDKPLIEINIDTGLWHEVRPRHEHAGRYV